MHTNQRGYTLNSLEVRSKISDGSLITPSTGNLDSRIQPASFDPIIGDEIFILETETGGLFRPTNQDTIYRNLLQLPQRQRQKASTVDFEMKKGFTYLIPLQDRIALKPNESVKSSPKSSIGRTFLNTRLLADFNTCFDEITYTHNDNAELMLWLLAQPLAFNTLLNPGLSLNQMRFFNGLDAQLTSREIISELEKNNLLYERGKDGQFKPLEAVVTDGLRVNLDLRGKHTEGIVALRARHNPNPIDLTKIGSYEAEDFFEPIVNKNGRVKIERGEHYLFASQEVLQIPKHLNVELKRFSHIGLRGDIHFAGFIDPGFIGDLVFEVKSDEPNDIMLDGDSIPVSTLQLFANKEPDISYGEKIGSHYHGQIGPKPAKYFKTFDYNYAARNYGKLSKIVLVQDAKSLKKINSGGFKPLNESQSAKLSSLIQEGFFHSRYDCESDEEVLQIIPYVLVFDNKNKVFSYVRAGNISDYGDHRLYGKHSIGVGGHILGTDGPDYLKNGLRRELREEINLVGAESEPKLYGTLVSREDAVSKVHFGLVYSLHCDSVSPRESSLLSGRTVPIEELMADTDAGKKYEVWSRILIDHLPTLIR